MKLSLSHSIFQKISVSKTILPAGNAIVRSIATVLRLIFCSLVFFFISLLSFLFFYFLFFILFCYLFIFLYVVSCWWPAGELLVKIFKFSSLSPLADSDSSWWIFAKRKKDYLWLIARQFFITAAATHFGFSHRKFHANPIQISCKSQTKICGKAHETKALFTKKQSFLTDAITEADCIIILH